MRKVLGVVVATWLFGFGATKVASATPLVVAITKIVQQGNDLDTGLFEGPVGDFFVRVTIDGVPVDNAAHALSYGFDLGAGFFFPFTIHLRGTTLQPFWTLSRELDPSFSRSI